MKKLVWAVGAVVVGGGLAFWACQKEPAPAPAPAPVAAPAPAPVAPAPAPAGKGSVEGSVSLTGTPPTMEPLKRGSDPVCAKTPMNDESALVHGGKIENVLVRIKGAPNAPAVTDALEVDQKDCMYRPRVQGAVAGQSLSIKNTDATLHNVHSYSGSKTLFNRAQPPRSAPISNKLDDGTVMKLKCDVHPWMTGYVLVTNNALFAVTGADGKFSIKNVPAGTYTIEAWHEKFGTKTATVTVAPDKTANVDVSYSADDRG